MNIRILKKLRKQAHDSVRVVPEGEGCRVQKISLSGYVWVDVPSGYFTRSEMMYKKQEINEYLENMRSKVLMDLVDEVLYIRRFERLSKL